MFACLGVIMSLVQGGYIRRAMVNNEIKIAKRSIIILIIGFLIVGCSSSKTLLYVGLLPFAFAAASVVPCLSSAAASYGGVSQKGRMMGTIRALGALARATGPCFCAVSYWLFGSRNVNNFSQNYGCCHRSWIQYRSNIWILDFEALTRYVIQYYS